MPRRAAKNICNTLAAPRATSLEASNPLLSPQQPRSRAAAAAPPLPALPQWFKSWHPTDAGTWLMSALVLAALGVAHEALASYRVSLSRAYYQQKAGALLAHAYTLVPGGEAAPMGARALHRSSGGEGTGAGPRPRPPGAAHVAACLRRGNPASPLGPGPWSGGWGGGAPRPLAPASRAGPISHERSRATVAPPPQLPLRAQPGDRLLPDACGGSASPPRMRRRPLCSAFRAFVAGVNPALPRGPAAEAAARPLPLHPRPCRPHPRTCPRPPRAAR